MFSMVRQAKSLPIKETIKTAAISIMVLRGTSLSPQVNLMNVKYYELG
jgi:hypothetical protein